MVAGFVLLANFSTTSQKFECIGQITRQEQQRAVTLYVELEKYRWWVRLWSDSRGNLKLEIPHETLDYFEHIAVAGNQLQIYSPPSKPKGYFSTLSKGLALETSDGFFEGSCMPTE